MSTITIYHNYLDQSGPKIAHEWCFEPEYEINEFRWATDAEVQNSRNHYFSGCPKYIYTVPSWDELIALIK